jgi:hypothetical protein
MPMWICAFAINLNNREDAIEDDPSEWQREWQNGGPHNYYCHTSTSHTLWERFFNLILLRDVTSWVLFNFSLQLSHRI